VSGEAGDPAGSLETNEPASGGVFSTTTSLAVPSPVFLTRMAFPTVWLRKAPGGPVCSISSAGRVVGCSVVGGAGMGVAGGREPPSGQR
jgi:hypothetical protein